jgi:hypothetical protein
VYEALSCAQVLVYEALSDLEECDQVGVWQGSIYIYMYICIFICMYV